jgi:hypothetical protein
MTRQAQATTVLTPIDYYPPELEQLCRTVERVLHGHIEVGGPCCELAVPAYPARGSQPGAAVSVRPKSAGPAMLLPEAVAGPALHVPPGGALLTVQPLVYGYIRRPSRNTLAIA